jgi:endonuclease-3
LRESLQKKAERAQKIDQALQGNYPDQPALLFDSTFQLLIATILSAQCTDERVNMVTGPLFEKYPTPAAFAEANLDDIAEAIHSTGFYKQKARSIQGACRDMVEKHNGLVPLGMEEMVRLPGVGRKTANVVLGNGEGIAYGVVVDTHVKRLANRMGLTTNSNPDKIEQDLMKLLPPHRWTAFSNMLIYLGRDKCKSRKTLCEECIVNELCPKVGVSN